MYFKKMIYFFFFWAGLFLFTSQLTAQPHVTLSLQETLTQKQDDQFISVNIRLADQYEARELNRKASQIRDPRQRRHMVVNELKAFSLQQQSSLIAFLQQMQDMGKAKEIKPYWIGNLVNVKVLPEVVQALSTRKDLSRLDHNTEHMVITPEFLPDPAEKDNNIAWSLPVINAPEVWESGFRGRGVVVAVIDSGVNYQHADLQGNMWVHPDFPNHGYNTNADNFITMDPGGHGTHVAGTVAGNGVSGRKTGVAPQAKIMAIRSLSNTGSGTEAHVWAAIEFAVEHGADIINLSMGWKHSWDPDRAMWRTVMDNVHSAGMVAAVANGNEGNENIAPDEVRTPANVPAPWIHPDQSPGGISSVIAVGAINEDNQIPGFSSKGPVTWANVDPYNDYPFSPGMGLIRPDVVAPGTNIPSLAHNSNTGYVFMNGTSMATPAVAGVIALMVSKNPYLTPGQISQILEETAYSSSTVKSIRQGSGRVDAQAAVMATPYLGAAQVIVDDSQGNNDGLINPGEIINLNITLENTTSEAFEDLSLRLNMLSPYVQLTDSIYHIPAIAPGQELEIPGAASFIVCDSVHGGHLLEMELIVYEQQNPDLKWRRHFEKQVYGPALQVVSYWVDDSEQGNNNTRLDPGESAMIIMEITNNGQLPSGYIEAALDCHYPLFFFENSPLWLNPIAQGDTVQIEFDVIAHENIPQGLTAELLVTLNSGALKKQEVLLQKIGMVYEDWESGSFDQFNWLTMGDEQWYLVDNESATGTYSARSGNIIHNQTSSLIMDYEVLADDSIAFYRKVSSENSRDWLDFYIDDELMGSWSGNQNWARVSFPVQSGNRQLRWIYRKDPSITIGQDCGWIDHIELPAMEQTSVVAGFDMTVCGTEPLELGGFATLYDNLQWTTDGDGAFSDPHSINTIYSPGAGDITQGYVNISLDVSHQQQPPLSDSFLLQFLDQPSVSLGQDVTVCTNHTLLLDAGHEHDAFLWFDGSTEQTYLVDHSNFNVPEAEIWVTVFHENGCFASDTINVMFDECVSTDKLASHNQITIYPVPANHMIYISFTNEAGGPVYLSLLNANGITERIKQIDPGYGIVQIPFELTGIKPGIYFISVKNNNGAFTRKVIIQ